MASVDPRVDAYIAKAADFAQPILLHLRAAVHAGCADVEETIKWSHPHFLYRGRILCSMAAFKQHAAFGFSLATPNPTGDDGKREQAMGQFGRIGKIADMPSKKVFNDGLRQAMRLIEAGVKRPVSKNAKPKPLRTFRMTWRRPCLATARRRPHSMRSRPAIAASMWSG